VSEHPILDTLDRIEAILEPPQVKATLSPADLCKQYKTIRPLLLVLLPWIAQIPVYGEKIAAVIKFLMGIADGLCPAT